MRSAVAFQVTRRGVRGHYQTGVTGAAGVEFHAGACGRVVDEILKTVALGSLGGDIECKVLSNRTRTRRLLFETLVGFLPIINRPFRTTMAAGQTGVRIQVEQLTFLTRPLRELPVAPLMRSPPMPIVKSFAVFLVFTLTSSIAREEQPFAKMARSPSIRLVTLVVLCL